MSRNPTSLMLVAIQGLMLTYLFLGGVVVPNTILVGLLELGGFALAFWGIWTLRTSTIQITPDVAPESVLITNGPYSYIRHPMYAGILLVVIGLLLNDFSWLRFIAVVILFIDLIVKTEYEEILLVKHFKKEFRDYQKKTYRFIPFIY